MNKTVLVTGSEGYIGAELCPFLERCGYDVEKFDLKLGNNILDIKEIEDCVYDCDVIVHLSGIVGMKAVDENEDRSFLVNVEGGE